MTEGKSCRWWNTCELETKDVVLASVRREHKERPFVVPNGSTELLTAWCHLAGLRCRALLVSIEKLIQRLAESVHLSCGLVCQIVVDCCVLIASSDYKNGWSILRHQKHHGPHVAYGELSWRVFNIDSLEFVYL